jgi:ClpP class serine protease
MTFASGLYCRESMGRIRGSKLGLVDRIGSLDDAINEAAVLAKVKTYKTQNYPEYKRT